MQIETFQHKHRHHPGNTYFGGCVVLSAYTTIVQLYDGELELSVTTNTNQSGACYATILVAEVDGTIASAAFEGNWDGMKQFIHDKFFNLLPEQAKEIVVRNRASIFKK